MFFSRPVEFSEPPALTDSFHLSWSFLIVWSICCVNFSCRIPYLYVVLLSYKAFTNEFYQHSSPICTLPDLLLFKWLVINALNLFYMYIPLVCNNNKHLWQLAKVTLHYHGNRSTNALFIKDPPISMFNPYSPLSFCLFNRLFGYLWVPQTQRLGDLTNNIPFRPALLSMFSV